MEMSKNSAFSVLLVGVLMGLVASSQAYDFYVGGRDGWVSNPSESYSSWAGRNRFQINDTLVFKYNSGADSALVVTKQAYDKCNISNPIRKLEGGNSAFRLERSGPFYFISGVAENCQKGQKLVVVVLADRSQKRGQSPPSPPLAPISPSPAPAVQAVSPSLTPSPATNAHAPARSPLSSPSASPVSSPSSTSPAPSPSSTSPAPNLSDTPVSSPLPVYLVPLSSPTEAPAPMQSSDSPPPPPNSSGEPPSATEVSPSSPSPPNPFSAYSGETASTVTLALVAMILGGAFFY